MAARRLLIVMLILLGASTLAAALLPDREERATTEEERAPPATQPTTGKAPAPERSFDLRIEPHRVQVFEAKVGEQLALKIRSDRAGLLEIPALGLVDAVAPGAPARFNLLPSEPGSYGVRFLGRQRVVARIEVKG